MNKICIILPPNPILDSPKMQVNLGALYVASAIEKEGYNVEIIDMRNLKKIDIGMIPVKYDMYGVSFTTGEYNYAKELSIYIKKTYPTSIIVAGGAHPTHEPLTTLQDTDFNVVVIGEGEITTIELLKKNNLHNVQGIAFKENDKIYINKSRPVINDIDSIPFPARHLLPFDDVFTTDIYRGARYGNGDIGTTLMTARGCPYSCSYCANWDNKLRLRSIQNVVDEIQMLKDDYNCTHFRFVDDEFGIPQKRGIELCKALEPMNIKFRCHTRADNVTPELMQAMYRGGCEELAFGIETPDEDILKMVNKQQTYEQCIYAVSTAKKYGLRTKVYLMVCLPGETWESIEKTKKFMLEAKPDKWTLSTCIPYPGCDMQRNPAKYNINILVNDFSKYWLYQDESIIETNVVSKKELTEHRIHLMNWLINYDKTGGVNLL